MIDKLQTVITHHNELAELMSQPDAMQDMKAFTKMAREHRSLTELVDTAKKYIDTYNQLQEDEEILDGDDPELKELVKDEIGELRYSLIDQEEKLKVLLIPKTRKMTKTLFWKSAAEPEAMRLPFLQGIFTECIYAMPSDKAGKWKSCP